ncbi:hypothetical protein SAMN04488700_2239 [Carnobacterium iners]|uniref:Carbon monoxide dehydrogenase subunit G n=1 Tax=Carnobacterium iners TaxID=1073423 RepID=A0A1X7NN16_9LACT|nr:hypothetical protein [Carnobacterium iners]SEK30983.1 hypothetical protein SAMN04488114_102136 [Carnobacterium iners]SMH39394.1 hypothetical protein SAMN04488700_2239 [Carnobacterium iners]
MSLNHYSITINAPFNNSCERIKEPSFWLTFLPGFDQLTSISESIYLIDLYLSLGPVSRKALLTFKFKPETKMTDVLFTFSSSNKSVSGLGQLTISQYSENAIQLKVSLDLQLKGKKSLLLTPLLPSVKESWAKNILNQVKFSLENEQ